ncbi:MAG: replicative DNA helicase [Phycisphaerales bacterium]|nr:replicative DNA helicase [Phycisphaerales bacterium]
MSSIATGGRRRKDEGRPKVDASTVGRLFDRLPPHAPEAEMALLGSMVLGPEVIADVLHIVSRPEQFFMPAHGAIFRVLVDTYNRHRSGDLVQLVDALRDASVLDEVGGEAYLVQLAESVPTASNAPYYARIVADKARLRSLIDTAGTIIYDAYHAGDLRGEGLTELVDRAETAIFEIAEQDQTSEPAVLGDLLQQELERIEAAEGGGISGLPSGYDDLDGKLRGLQPGELIIVAARPSMGKTAFALNLAEQIARGGLTPWDSSAGREPIPVAFFSLEMSKSSVTQRLLSAFSGVQGTLFRDGSRISPEDWERIMKACNSLAEMPLYIDDSPGLTVMQLRARARRMASRYKIKCIMIDYLQLLTAPTAARESRQVEVSTISRQIKALARELNVPVVCLAQLNRGTEQREGNRPRMSDLRESGSIEQDADVVALLHREEYYHINNPRWIEEHPDKKGLAELIVAKQRNGPTGVVRLTWDNTTTRFKNYTAQSGYDEMASFDNPVYEPKPQPGYAAPPAQPHQPPQRQGGAFAPGGRTGPAANHRDGGGPDDDTGAPF